jgi:hypothetical protein
MIKLVSVVFTCLWIILPVTVTPQLGGKEPNTDQAIQDRFVGAWRLASLEELGADGQMHRVDCSGMLVYSADGHMSVQVMYRSPQPGTSAAPVQYTQGGYEASFGTYQVKNNRSFTFHVEGSLVRSLIGKDLPRAYEFSGKQFIVRSTDPKEHWRVVWERY